MLKVKILPVTNVDHEVVLLDTEVQLIREILKKVGKLAALRVLRWRLGYTPCSLYHMHEWLKTLG